MSSYMSNFLTLEFICANDYNIGPSVPYYIKKVYLCLVSDKSCKVCQEQGNGVTYMSLNNIVYDSELVTSTILYFNYIHFMQNVLHLCPKIYTHYPSKQKGQFSLCE